MSRKCRNACGVGLAAAALILAWPLGAQSQGAPSQGAATAQAPSAKPPGPMPNFTGNVGSMDASDLLATRLKYEAGARSFWHAHEGALVLLIEQGRGRYQVKGEKIREFGPGEAIYLPGNVPHWHGASATEGLTWVALAVGGRKVTVVGPVTDEEYLGKAK